VNHQFLQSGTTARGTLAGIVVEALVVLAAGIAAALIANLVSPRGLELSRNYFPGAGAAPPISNGAPGRPATNSAPFSPAEYLAARMREQGLQLVDESRAAQWFQDSKSQSGGIVFVDARDESHYRGGHIPGAYEFDPYYPEKYFPTALPPCQAAETVVVYCNGGDCDDSQSAALLLRDVGIANQKLFIYGGGMPDWIAHGLPVETGSRNSGNLHPETK